ncbi:sigma 54-interacting transcriptional regulator, partial [Pseudoalteromonas piscicida]
ISATNDNLHEAVGEGRFRQDLLYRINTVEIALPPLRERHQDIPLLVDYYLNHFGQKYKRELSVSNS